MPDELRLLRIRDWGKNFEKSDAKKLKSLSWVSLPTDLLDIRYRILIDHPEGAAHFAAWIAIVEIASACTVRGTLMEGGMVLNARHLSIKSGLPTEIFEAAIPRLLELRWLEEVSKPGDFPGGPGDSPVVAGENHDYITEQNRQNKTDKTKQTEQLRAPGGARRLKSFISLELMKQAEISEEQRDRLYSIASDDEIAAGIGGVQFDDCVLINGQPIGVVLAAEVAKRLESGEPADPEVILRDMGLAVGQPG
jgi:hypothetical protein